MALLKSRKYQHSHVRMHVRLGIREKCTYQQDRRLPTWSVLQTAACRHLCEGNTRFGSFDYWSRTPGHSRCCTAEERKVMKTGELIKLKQLSKKVIIGQKKWVVLKHGGHYSTWRQMPLSLGGGVRCPWVIHFINATFESKCDGLKFVTISAFSYSQLLSSPWSGLFKLKARYAQLQIAGKWMAEFTDHTFENAAI